MSKYSIISLVFLFHFNVAFCQTAIHFNINGHVKGQLQPKDSIIFLSEFVNSKYYEKPFFLTPLAAGQFIISGKISYPQPYRVRLSSETNSIPYRAGYYFFDSSVKAITVGDSDKDSDISSKSGQEYITQFMPYFLAPDYKSDIEGYAMNKGNEFDKKLKTYIDRYPNSYVALWFLIARFNYNGYDAQYVEFLKSFSISIRSGKLWKTLNDEITNIHIKEGTVFPVLLLKNIDFKHETVKIQNSKFTLIDFWFSRCAPCIEQIPQLKTIYNKFRPQGFNIIAISTDYTKNVSSFWQKRVTEWGIPWKNFLDENAFEANKEKIFSFPTNYLLNKEGKVIRKNISLDELEIFLSLNTFKASEPINSERKF